MSYKELRSFTEIMRSIGYPRPISLESFRLPNFELVADILVWLVTRCDPGAEIDDDITTDMKRVNFLKEAASVCQSKAHIKLNMKKLYIADGHAVKELLKLATMLRDAMNIEEDPEGEPGVESLRMSDSMETRKLASELTEEGYRLYELLDFELRNRDLRNKIVNRPPEVNEIGKALNKTNEDIAKQIQALSESCINLQSDETNLEAKIENKKAHLERLQKRLSQLKNVCPAFMEEYQQLEVELQKQYTLYLEQFRNLNYLEHELAKFNKMEDALLEQLETKLVVMREKLRMEELEVLRGHRLPDDALLDVGATLKRAEPDNQMDIEEASMAHQAEDMLGGADDRGAPPSRKARGSSARAGQKRQRPESGRAGSRQVAVKREGNMYDGEDSDDDDSDDDEDSSSDGNLSVADDSDDDDDDDD
eukprot:Sspe_Gene.48960::Locus_25928_Transcript_1_1_Confidence_1.000_Length_1336::g.48960::m.48960/K19684/CLUAP1, DYF3; clusterin-associated protein 1